MEITTTKLKYSCTAGEITKTKLKCEVLVDIVPTVVGNSAALVD